MERIDKIITKLVLLVLLTTSNISVYAQTTEDITLPDVFPTEDAVWVIEVEGQAERSWANPETGLWYDIYYTYYTYYLEGDTIMNDKKYSKLYVKNIQKNIDYGYVGGIRVEGEKVYIDPVDFDYETLNYFTGGRARIFFGVEEDEEGVFDEFCLYDFSLNEEDEFITVTFFEDMGCPYCTPIEMYNWGNNDIQEEWIKGIGSKFGLWYDRVTTTTGMGSNVNFTLKSFHYKGKQFYPTEESGINESTAEINNTKAYVSNRVLYIENAEGINSVTVYDAMGRTLLTPNPSPAERGVEITLPDIKGVLIVKVNNEVVKVICE
ncbi:MAG: hypothetical protein IKB57_01065 [Bacteroidaceae bacterium]|nr:hypothetical protein [Bacteroidaceae bacterium]